MSPFTQRLLAKPKTASARRFLRLALSGTVAALVVFLASFSGRNAAPDPDRAVESGDPDPAWHAGTLSGIEQQEYHASLTPEGLQAPNRAG